MGLGQRKKSGKIIAGSTMIVPGQPVLSVKKFEVTFSKKGSSPDDSRETPSPTPTPNNN